MMKLSIHALPPYILYLRSFLTFIVKIECNFVNLIKFYFKNISLKIYKKMEKFTFEFIKRCL